MAREWQHARGTRGDAHSSHSTTVPWIWKKGKPTLVCHDCGDLRMRLLRVSLCAKTMRVSGVRAARGTGRALLCLRRSAPNLGVGARPGVGKVVGHCVVLGVVLELFRRDGRAEKVLEVLEDVLLTGRKGARLRVF